VIPQAFAGRQPWGGERKKTQDEEVIEEAEAEAEAERWREERVSPPRVDIQTRVCQEPNLFRYGTPPIDNSFITPSNVGI